MTIVSAGWCAALGLVDADRVDGAGRFEAAGADVGTFDRPAFFAGLFLAASLSFFAAPSSLRPSSWRRSSREPSSAERPWPATSSPQPSGRVASWRWTRLVPSGLRLAHPFRHRTGVRAPGGAGRTGILSAMGSSSGRLFRITTFGESHGGGVGVVIDGCPPGLELGEERHPAGSRPSPTGPESTGDPTRRDRSGGDPLRCERRSDARLPHCAAGPQQGPELGGLRPHEGPVPAVARRLVDRGEVRHCGQSPAVDGHRPGRRSGGSLRRRWPASC